MLKVSVIKKYFGVNLSLKIKIALAFAVVVLVMGTVNIAAVFTLRNSTNKLNRMVETTILANDIINSVAQIPDLLTQFILLKTEKEHGAVVNLLSEMEQNLIVLDNYIEAE